jgi:hypothetical protein
VNSEPKIDERAEQAYMGIRTVTLWQQLPTVIPQFIGEVSISWVSRASTRVARRSFAIT